MSSKLHFHLPDYVTGCSDFQWVNLPESREVINDYQVVCLVDVEYVNPHFSPRTIRDIMWDQGFFLLLIVKRATNVAKLNEVLNLTRHGGPIHTFSRPSQTAVYANMGCMNALEHVPTKGF